MKLPRQITTTLLLAAVFLACIPCSGQRSKPQPPPPPPPPLANPEIVYVAERGWSQTDLMVMNADGSNQKVILAGGRVFGNHDPNWSPDGNRIVFGSNVWGNGIYLINKDGSGLCKVVSTYDMPAWGPGAPKWSPDGAKIVYTTSPGPGGQEQDLFLVDATCNAAPPVNLTNSPAIAEFHPTWAPDSLRVAANAYGTSATPDVIIFDLVTGITTNLTATGTLAQATLATPDWARLSDRIAVAARPSDTDQFDVWIIDLNFPDIPVQITRTTDIQDWQPSWSPSDQQIVFERAGSIYVMYADGSTPKLLAAPSNKRTVTLRAPDWRRAQ